MSRRSRPARRLRILLVDDCAVLLDQLQAFLKALGLEVAGVATSAAMALDSARELRPQVVVLDISMPGRNGLEVLPELRSLLPDATLVVLTLHDDEAYRRAAFSRGADAFVSKAMIGTELVPAIRGGRKAPNPRP